MEEKIIVWVIFLLTVVYGLGVLANIEARRWMQQSWLKIITWSLMWPITRRMDK